MVRYQYFLAIVLGLMLSNPVLANKSGKRDYLIFSTAPTQSTEATIKRYKPLVDFLSRYTGKKIILEPAENFVDFSEKMLDNHYDIVFDGPQFVGWRMQKFNHEVIAKLPGKLRFVVVVRDDLNVTHVKRLAGKRVCSVASPNLLTLGFLDLYPNPARVPVITSSKNFNDALRCASKGEGVAAIMRDKFWKKKPAKAKKGLKLFLHSSSAWPHRAFSVSPRVDAQTREKLRQGILGAGGTKYGAAILKQFKAKTFVPATTQEYQGLGRLLKPIWGFHDQ